MQSNNTTINNPINKEMEVKQPQVILMNVSEFMEHLKEHNLCVAPIADFKFEKNIELIELKAQQKKLLNKPALTPGEIVKFKLTHYTSTHSVKGSKYIKPAEKFKGKDGKYKIATCAIERIREIKHL